MSNTRVLTIPILCAMVGTSVLCAGDFSTYRGLQFGMNLATAAKQVAATLTEMRVVHQRPAVIQEIEWLPRSSSGSPFQADPFREGLLCFYNGELYRIVVTYDRHKVEGMTTSDMIQAISATYGMATRPAAQIPYHSNYGEVAEVIARWEDTEYAYNLVRTGDQSSFALILYSKRLDALAQAAIVEAARLDAQEAPQREIERQNKQEADAQLVLDQARSVNKPNFRP